MKDTSQPSDGELVAVFAGTGDEVAFAELIGRHGAMVQGVCLRVLGNFHEAQDVTQAVFVTLARKAASLRKDPSVGSWLHHVALCLARNVRAANHSRQRREEQAMHEVEVSTEPCVVDTRALRAELDDAIGRLPERYRLPLVLFHLEERSLEQTAQALALNIKTASTRLVRGREMLRKKLIRRGVTAGAIGALTTLLSAEAGAAVLPATFVSATVQAASLAATGKLAAGVGTGVVSAKVAALTKGAVNMLFWSSVKTASVVTAAAIVLGGAGVTTYVALAGNQPKTVIQQRETGPTGGLPKSGERQDARTDLEKDPYTAPLPKGATLRLGTVRNLGLPAISPTDSRAAVIMNGTTLLIVDLRTGRELSRIEIGQQDAFHHLAYLPDGKRLLCLCANRDDGLIRVLDGLTGKEDARIQLPQDRTGKHYVAEISLGPQGQTVAMCSSAVTEDCLALRVWNIAERKEIVKYVPAKYDHHMSFRYAPGEKTLALVSAEAEQDVILFDLASGRQILRTRGPWFAFSPNGELVATPAPDPGKVNVWKCDSGKLAGTVAGAYPFLLSPDNKHVVVSVLANYAKRNSECVAFQAYDLETFQPGQKFVNEDRYAMSLMFALKGKILAAAGWNKMSFWDFGSGRKLPDWEAFKLHRGHDEVVTLHTIQSHDGNLLAVCGRDGGPASVLNANTREVLCEIAGYPVSFSTDGSFMLMAGGEIWDIVSRKPVFPPPSSGVRHKRGIESVAFSPDGKFVATGGSDGTRLWDAAGGKHKQEIPHAGMALAWSPDGQELAMGGYQRLVLWKVSENKEMKEAKAHGSHVNSLVFSPDGRFLASGCDRDDTLELWDARTGDPLRSIKLPRIANFKPAVQAIAFSSDGRLVACVTGVNDLGAFVFDTDTGNEHKRMIGKDPFSPFMAVAFTSDGKALITPSRNKGIDLWEVATGNLLRTIQTGNSTKWEWVLSPDSRKAAILGGEIAFWDITANRQLEDFPSAARCGAFSPCGKRFVSGHEDGTALIWDLKQ